MENIQEVLNEVDKKINAPDFYELIVSVDNLLKQGRWPSSASAEYPDRQC